MLRGPSGLNFPWCPHHVLWREQQLCLSPVPWKPSPQEKGGANFHYSSLGIFFLVFFNLRSWTVASFEEVQPAAAETRRGWSLSPEQWRGGPFRAFHIAAGSVSGPQNSSALVSGEYPSFPKMMAWCYRAQLLDWWLDLDFGNLSCLGSVLEPGWVLSWAKLISEMLVFG